MPDIVEVIMDINQLIENSEKSLTETFKKIDSVALYNQEKVLSAFKQERIALRHFAGTTGYGYDDIGRDTLGKLYADVFHTESAIVSPLIANGTHAISIVFATGRYYVFDIGRSVRHAYGRHRRQRYGVFKRIRRQV